MAATLPVPEGACPVPCSAAAGPLRGDPTCDEFKLSKVVDKADATSGSTILSTIRFQNSDITTLTPLKIEDSTPACTNYADSSCATLAANLACKVAIKPDVGPNGQVE